MGVLGPEVEDCYGGVVDGDKFAGARSQVHEVEACLRAELGLGPGPDGVRVALIEAQDAALAVRPQVRRALAPRTRFVEQKVAGQRTIAGGAAHDSHHALPCLSPDMDDMWRMIAP
jgi:hypothetical protein